MDEDASPTTEVKSQLPSLQPAATAHFNDSTVQSPSSNTGSCSLMCVGLLCRSVAVRTPPLLHPWHGQAAAVVLHYSFPSITFRLVPCASTLEFGSSALASFLIFQRY